MGDYNRSTREIKIEELSAETTDTINKHLELYNLGPLLNDVLICIESVSEKIKKGLFGGPGPKTLKDIIILTPRWLIQVIKSDNDSAFARSAQLSDITVVDYEKSPFYTRIPDSGVNVNGKFTDASENSTTFIGLGKDVAGRKFKELLINAVQNEKK